MRRSHFWLEEQLKFLLSKYFSDVKLSNPLEIRFGREAKYRFGSIKLYRPKKPKRISNFPSSLKLRWASKKVPQKSIITITSMFTKPNVPVRVVHYTIAHELCHYAHGFSSANKRLFKFPHHGGVVNRELIGRGAQDLIISYKKWLKTYRKKILASRIKI